MNNIYLITDYEQFRFNNIYSLTPSFAADNL